MNMENPMDAFGALLFEKMGGDEMLMQFMKEHPENAKEFLDAHYEAQSDFILENGEINHQTVREHMKITDKFRMLFSAFFSDLVVTCLQDSIEKGSRERTPGAAAGVDYFKSIGLLTEVGPGNAILDGLQITSALLGLKSEILDDRDKIRDKTNIVERLVGTTLVLKRPSKEHGMFDVDLDLFERIEPVLAQFDPAIRIDIRSASESNISKPDNNTIQIVRAPLGELLPMRGEEIDKVTMQHFADLYARGEVLWSNRTVLAGAILLNMKGSESKEEKVAAAVKQAQCPDPEYTQTILLPLL